MHCEALERERTLKRWVTDYVGFVARVLRGAGTPAAEVDDAVQRTFIIAARRQADVRAGAERSFLLQTALNVAAHARRSAARRREAPASELPELVDAATPEQLTSLKHDRALLERVLSELPPELRSVLVLSEVEELSRDEIAACLAIPPGTVASRLRRAREQLRERWRVERGVSAALGLAAFFAAVRARAASFGAWVARTGGPKLVAAASVAVVVPISLVALRAPTTGEAPAVTTVLRTAAPAVVAAKALPEPAAPVLGTAPEPLLTPEPAKVAPSVPAPSAPKRPSVSEALQQELAQLDVVRARLATGRAEQALSLLDAYDRGTPRGSLRLEAEVLRIDALSRSGRMEQARARARAFLTRHPTSVLAARVRRLAGD
ncbi:MAG: hypothetical protein K0R38_2555 [Polyangiaceae bacterium]|jgi:RNA polymerase sigma-70 factor (ECF subfamily)|nr:hypothetical protein [Polyangiaceae bacterium]